MTHSYVQINNNTITTTNNNNNNNNNSKAVSPSESTFRFRLVHKLQLSFVRPHEGGAVLGAKTEVLSRVHDHLAPGYPSTAPLVKAVARIPGKLERVGAQNITEPEYRGNFIDVGFSGRI